MRLLAAPLLAAAILQQEFVLASSLLALAVVTDLLDGRVARRYGEVSPLGGLLDHATDATFVSIGLAALAWQGVVPGPLPVLVAAAFIQYTLDSRALQGSALRASALGRANGIAYFVILGTPLVRETLGLGFPTTASSARWAGCWSRPPSPRWPTAESPWSIPLRQRLASVLLVAASATVALVLAELFLRVFAPIPYSMKVEFLADPHVAFRLTPNRVYRLASGGRCTVNALGYRGREIEVPKPEETFRDRRPRGLVDLLLPHRRWRRLERCASRRSSASASPRTSRSSNGGGSRATARSSRRSTTSTASAISSPTR